MRGKVAPHPLGAGCRPADGVRHVHPGRRRDPRAGRGAPRSCPDHGATGRQRNTWPAARSPHRQPGVPVLRVTSVAQVLPFDLDHLGSTPDGSFASNPGLPPYVQVSRSPVVLQLSEHHGDSSPHGVPWSPAGRATGEPPAEFRQQPTQGQSRSRRNGRSLTAHTGVCPPARGHQ
ncbi:glyoxalase superfamily protein [Streptomyces sp. NPDC058737]|uniref:glyoxalase superfamily protein n=1 Tax=Streptomyces sp. NPDC058737 TaxID=3346617 RepID=UPI0036762CEA